MIFAKEIFKEFISNFKSPQKVSLTLILLFIAKIIDNESFLEVLAIIQPFKQTVVSVLKFFSIISFVYGLVGTILLLMVLIDEAIPNKRKILPYEGRYSLQFIVIDGFTWMWLFIGFIYFIDGLHGLPGFFLNFINIFNSETSSLKDLILIVLSIFPFFVLFNIFKDLASFFFSIRINRDRLYVTIEDVERPIKVTKHESQH